MCVGVRRHSSSRAALRLMRPPSTSARACAGRSSTARFLLIVVRSSPTCSASAVIVSSSICSALCHAASSSTGLRSRRAVFSDSAISAISLSVSSATFARTVSGHLPCSWSFRRASMRVCPNASWYPPAAGRAIGSWSSPTANIESASSMTASWVISARGCHGLGCSSSSLTSTNGSSFIAFTFLSLFVLGVTWWHSRHTQPRVLDTWSKWLMVLFEPHFSQGPNLGRWLAISTDCIEVPPVSAIDTERLAVPLRNEPAALAALQHDGALAARAAIALAELAVAMQRLPRPRAPGADQVVVALRVDARGLSELRSDPYRFAHHFPLSSTTSPVNMSRK